MANKADWLHDLLRDYAAWHNGQVSEDEVEHAYGDSDTLWRASMSPIRMPAHSSPPRGAIPVRRDLNHLIQAMNVLCADSDVWFQVGVTRAFYLTSLEGAAEAAGISPASVWKYKQMGEAALRGFMAA